MASLNAATLMALGFFDQQAKALGFDATAQTTTGTTQGTPTPNNNWVNLTAHASTGAITLPAAPTLFDIYVVRNVSASNAAAVFPAVGGIINAGAADASVAIAAKLARAFICVDTTSGATKWVSFLTA